MGPFQWFLFVYVLGGLTFVPLLIALVFLFAYYTFPPPILPSLPPVGDPAQLKREDDEKSIFKSGTDDLVEKFQRKHESDVAAGYFAVCREYVPGGVNGRPPEKVSPAGEVVANESPSVYQSMYRSIFDRSQKPTIEPNKDGAGKNVKKANKIFYVVLRHAHLMLYDDIQQLDVRYVISLEYHDVDIYGGGEEIPEGELWMKRNAIRLTRKQKQPGDKTTSLPFFLFSENGSEKEDFYFALLKNQEKSADDLPEPQNFDVDHIVKLVQKLHSSEEHLQTRWLNALIGRWFLAIYKTPEMENLIRQKLTKKISRVKKPNFITKLALGKINTGDGAPFITNPRLKDLTVNGDCLVEFDVLYTGNFRIEVAATARIDLGARFKAREVDMVLAATCKKLQGHVLLKFKPPPSNRIWFTFEKMPQLDVALEPIVSSRQITYNVILRQIESRLREVVAETIVSPFWDDFEFLNTAKERYRGGIWKREETVTPTTEIKNEAPEDEAEAGGSGTRTPDELFRGPDERNMSTPVLTDTKKMPVDRKSVSSMNEILGNKGDRSTTAQPPRVMRSTSFTSAAEPMVTVNHVDGDSPSKDTEKHKDSASEMLRGLSTRSATTPSGSQSGSPPIDFSMMAALKGRSDSNASKGSTDSTDAEVRGLSVNRSMTTTTDQDSRSQTPETSATNSGRSSIHEDQLKPKGLAQAARTLTTADRKQTVASISAATAAAQKWGWGVLARNRQKDGQNIENTNENVMAGPKSPGLPMGRGRPLPPPGIPLPPPERPSISSTFALPKRKAVPPPLLPRRSELNGTNDVAVPKPSPKPVLPERRNRQSSLQNKDDEDIDEVFVVEAPADSAPTSPAPRSAEHHDDFFGHGERASIPSSPNVRRPPPPLPLRSQNSQDSSTFTTTLSPEAAEVERTLSMREVASMSSAHNE